MLNVELNWARIGFSGLQVSSLSEMSKGNAVVGNISSVLLYPGSVRN